MKHALLALFFMGCGLPPEVDIVQQGLDVTYYNNYGVVSIAGDVLCHPEIPTDYSQCPYLVFWRTDNMCQFNSLSNSGPALTNSITVYGGTLDGGWANMAVVGSGQTRDVYCSNSSRGTWHFSMLQQGYNQVTMLGTGAADYMNCSGDPGGSAVVCHGQGGNDIMEDTSNLHVDMYGEDGDDKIRVLSLPTSNIGPNLFGGNGNDCLTSPSAQTWRDCGAGSDTANMSGQGCETVVSTTCP